LGLKKYDGKFYEIGTGRKIEGMLFADKIVDIFKYFGGNSRNEVRVRFATEIDEGFFNILKKLFSLEDGVGIKQGLFDVKKWIKNRKYPLWIVKYSVDNETIKDSIDRLNLFVNTHDEDIQSDDKKEFVTIINKNALEMDLKILFDKDKFENYFDKFLDSFGLDLPSKKDEIYAYIKSNIRANKDSDIAGWNEDKVKTLVYEWHTEELRKENSKHQIKNREEISQDDINTQIPIKEMITSDKIEKFKKQIIYAPIIKIILENVDDDYELYNVLNKYIED